MVISIAHVSLRNIYALWHCLQAYGVRRITFSGRDAGTTLKLGGKLLGQAVSQNLPPPPKKKSRRIIAESNARLLATDYLANTDAYKFMQ